MNDINYENVIDGELTKFEEPGMVVEGILQSYKEQRDTGKGPGHVYEVKTSKGIAAFFAPTLLHKKLSGIKIGNIVKITFINTSKTSNGNTLKNFDVKYAQATEANLKALGIEILETVEDGENKNNDFGGM